MKFIKKPSTTVVKPAAWNPWGNAANVAEERPPSYTITNILNAIPQRY